MFLQDEIDDSQAVEHLLFERHRVSATFRPALDKFLQVLMLRAAPSGNLRGLGHRRQLARLGPHDRWR